MLRRKYMTVASVALTVVATAAAAERVYATPAGVAAPVPAEDAGGEIIVVGDSGDSTTLSADALRDVAQAFRRHRAAFAPEARFMFTVDPVPGQSFDELDLRLRSNRRNRDGAYDRIDLPVNAAGQFALPVETVLTGDWALRSASRAGLRIRPLILSPGGTQFDRRFGDARLQCRVAVAFARMNFALRALAGAANVCNRSNVGLYLRTPRPIVSVSIAGWDRPIDVREDRLSFRVPLHERAISNDARMRVLFR